MIGEQEYKAGIRSIRRMLGSIWTEKPRILVSEHAAAKRILPTNTPFPGPWRNERTPYLVDPMDSMSAYSPIRREVILKGAQLGFTASAENVIAYWMDVIPAEILYITATEDLLLKWASKRLEPLIDSYGLRSRIFAQHAAKQSKRTGDRTFSKEFFGGAIDMASAQSAASLRSDSKRILARDELDGAPKNLRTGEGNWLDVSYARTFAYGDRSKIYDYSTPGTYEESVIYPEYELGNQMRFYVPCPHCGFMQILIWGHGYESEDPNKGMQWETRDGRVLRAWYVCEACGHEIHNRDKRTMLPGGEWRATAHGSDERVNSRQIGSIYSPIGMLDWRDMVVKYLDAREDPDKMRAFVTLYLGWPYRQTGARPDWSRVIELRGTYHAATVPEGVVFLTAAVDVQRGSDKTGKPARLEMEVCGHGIGYRTWSIEHRVFEGPIDDHTAGAWADLSAYWESIGFSYPRADGTRFLVLMGVVDSGDGPNVSQVYSFCQSWQGVLPCKGMASIRRKAGEPIDEDMNRSIRRFRLARLDSGILLLEFNGPFYKQQIYTNLKIQRRDDGKRPANFCDFPVEYTDEYFKQLTAEDMIVNPDGTIMFRQAGRENEALDLRIMNLAARDHSLNELVLGLQADAKQRGVAPEMLSKINSRTALEHLARGIPKSR